jgi:hypothetical protein
VASEASWHGYCLAARLELEKALVAWSVVDIEMVELDRKGRMYRHRPQNRWQTLWLRLRWGVAPIRI